MAERGRWFYESCVQDDICTAIIADVRSLRANFERLIDLETAHRSFSCIPIELNAEVDSILPGIQSKANLEVKMSRSYQLAHQEDIYDLVHYELTVLNPLIQADFMRWTFNNYS
jgi:hypothetical protein